MDQHISILIFSLFDGKDRWKGILFMLLFPYINNYIKYIYEWIKKLFYNKKSSIVLSVLHDKGKILTNNPSYKAVCWYSEKYVYEKLICEEHTSLNKKRIQQPIYYSNDTINFIYKNINIEISFIISENEKRLILRGKYLDILKKYVDEANTSYSENFFGTLDPNKIYVFYWKSPKYNNEDGDFVGTLMSINKTFQNVYLNKGIKEKIQTDIDSFLKNESYYSEKGIPYKRGYLLYGPPGTGKNSLIYAIAREYKMNLYILNLNLNSFEKSSNLIERIKNIIRKIPPCSILFLDEIDMQVYNDREKIIDKTENKTSSLFPTSGLMEILDGYEYLNGCLVFLTTNNKESLDLALIRPGRIDLHFFLDKLNHEDIKTTIKNFTSFDIYVPKQVSMTSSVLINQILLPNKNDKTKIEDMISSFE